MKKLLIIGLASVCTVLTMAPEGQSAATARVAWVRNTVQVTRGGRWVRAYNGVVVNSGAYVRTGSNSRAQIHYADGSVMRLGSRSIARVRYVGSKSVNLRRGKAYFKVNPQRKRMRVRTRTAVATVLGTEFLVEVKEQAKEAYYHPLSFNQFGYSTEPTQYAQAGGGGGSTQITTLSGLVGVTDPNGGNPIELGPGMTTFVPENMPPQPPTEADPNQVDQEGLSHDSGKGGEGGDDLANKPLDPSNPQQRTTVQQNTPGDGGSLDTTPTTGTLEVIIK